MRMSCNGCRVLRKGCSEDCNIKPCLNWIKNPDSQANATLFLAKFYGRAGLMNLLNVGPQHLRPAVFRSLLYEACGRIVNPIYGSVGLLWSGNWQLCHAAVEAVLKGAPIVQISSDATTNHPAPLLKPYDIRHVPKSDDVLHKVRTRNRFKRTGSVKSKPEFESVIDFTGGSDESGQYWEFEGAGSAESREDESFSVETVEASMLNLVNPGRVAVDENEVELELTLGGFDRLSRSA